MTRNRLAVAVLAISTCAAVALGQNADKNTAGPTKNDYRLRVMEPAEGAAITGPTVRVVVDTNVREQLGGEKRDVNSMPRPIVDIWMDGTRRGTMKDEENVLEIDNVSPGPHKLAIVAKNKANEIIDKKEINFSSTGSTVVEGANSSGTTPANPAPAETSAYSSHSTAPAPAHDSSIAGPASSTSSSSGSTYSSPSTSGSTYSSPQTSTSNQSSMSSRNTTSSSMNDSSMNNTTSNAENRARRKMPATASNDGALLLAGGALLLGSYLIRRKA